MSKSIVKKALSLILCFVLILSLAACASSIDKKLCGSWKKDGHTLTIYSDGTYEESYQYGTGEWTVLEGNILKLTNYYGETHTYKIAGVTSEAITLESGAVWSRITE